MFTPWDHGSTAYRTTLLTGTGLILLGIILSVLGALASALPLQWTALVLIGAGLVTHLAAQVLRIRDARRRHRPADR
ncbi:hypothetical protein [Citricoccus sp. SGAir0253]|uniref:hypothetical protein n=1 Tax=Citricoccus sp. SGAir0253 TaxID=2567881 RepID=UPI001AF016BF|nr:hypothetical protein [Citricoccus sp. SGAir0253]